MGPYCNFCGRRCFVPRTLPDFSWSGHMATCTAGMAHDRQELGHDHTTALNLAAPVPAGLALEQVDDGVWWIVHTESGKPIPLIDWPQIGVPHSCATVAAASLATSGIDWTQPEAELRSDLRRVTEAARTASTVAFDAAVHVGDRVDDRPPPLDLATRRASRVKKAAPATTARIVCLCGSTRFMAEMAEANRVLTAGGQIVLAPGCDLKEPHPLWDTDRKRAALKPQLDALHRAKIALADEVVVVTDQSRYIGDSTRAEIRYAEQLGKPWRWWTPASTHELAEASHG